MHAFERLAWAVSADDNVSGLWLRTAQLAQDCRCYQA